jgi:hypothetical protein
MFEGYSGVTVEAGFQVNGSIVILSELKVGIRILERHHQQFDAIGADTSFSTPIEGNLLTTEIATRNEVLNHECALPFACSITKHIGFRRGIG